MDDTLGLHEAADFCRLHFQTLRERAKAGKIPGAAKPGKEWVFLKIGLVEYLGSISPCRSTVSDKSGMSIYRANQRQADDLDDLLGLPTKSKRKNMRRNSGASYGDRKG